jgi:hypothetical protein
LKDMGMLLEAPEGRLNHLSFSQSPLTGLEIRSRFCPRVRTRG